MLNLGYVGLRAVDKFLSYVLRGMVLSLSQWIVYLRFRGFDEVKMSQNEMRFITGFERGCKEALLLFTICQR